MAIINKLLPQVDLPVWEWMRFAPGTATALTCLTTARDGTSRFLYYFLGTQLYRYDTVGDSWQTLSIGGAAVTTLTTQYVKNQGHRGYILGVPDTTTLQLPSIGTDVTGYKIKIISGTGEGQVRTITSTAAEVVHDSGLATTANTAQLADSTKKWKHNQWEGYAMKVIYGTGFSQYREVLYNDNTAATVFDANWEGKVFNMAPYSANVPYGTPNVGAGTQAMFTLCSQNVTVDSPWETPPNSSSRFMILSDGIWILTALAASPFFSFFYYDILTDRWVTKMTPAGMLPGALATDFTLVPLTDKTGGLPLIGSVTSSYVTSFTSQSIVDTSLTLTSGSLVGSSLRVISGSGTGQERRIISNTDKTITLASKFDVVPAVSSSYVVVPEDAIYVAGNARAEMHKYYPEPSLWTKGNLLDWGLSTNLTLYRPGKNKHDYGIASATRTTTAIVDVASTPTVAGTGYTVGDLLTISTGGTLGRVVVEQVAANGAVMLLSLYTCGSGYTTGTGKVTTGGTGTGCTVNITTVGTVATFTTTINADIEHGEVINFIGATEAAWNTTYDIIGIQSQTVFEAVTTATATAVPTYTLTTNLLVDPTKNWVSGEFAGKILGVQSNGLTGQVTYRKIIGNSPTTISFIAGTAPTNGTSRYFISELEAFGDDETYLADNQSTYGYSDSEVPGTLTDSTKNWFAGAWSGVRIQLTDSTGFASEDIITTNTSSSLNIGRTVAVGAGAVHTITYSDDKGNTWVGTGTTTFGTSGNGVAWSGTRFVAVGAGTNAVAWSNDGITWVPTALGATTFSTAGNGLCWNGIRFVAVGEGTNSVIYSADGLSWNQVALGATSFTTRGNAIAYNGSLHVAVGEGTNTISTSTDGITWVARGTTTFSTSGKAVCWNGSKWVVGGSGTNTVATSSNGTTWLAGTTPTNFTSVNGIAWNGTRFVAVGTVSSGTNCIAYSTDGLSWTVPTTGIFTQGNGVAWNGVTFVATGIASTNTVAYSTDGITWTAASTSTLFSTSGKGVASTTPFESMTPSLGIIPSNQVKYKILDTTGTAQGTQSTTQLQDLTKKWKVNQWAGKRVVLTSGTGITQELAIVSNTVNSLAFGVSVAPDVNTTYTIIGRPPSSTGIQLVWNYGSTVTADKGRLLIASRGGNSHTFDIYDIRTNRWKYGQYIQGAGDLLTTGTMYAYDGVDRIYFQVNSTGRINYYDINKNYIYPFSTVPYGMSTAVLGNRMEIIETVDGLKYLYVLRHTGTEMWRTLIYY